MDFGILRGPGINPVDTKKRLYILLAFPVILLAEKFKLNLRGAKP